ncbi:sialate O-acetylesterase [Olivibacter ginsenosidimutans]|uniref:Sialate O-acetylesterase n=1 Tax=Olivibacter ginsenosidimutans TaxID=1176537 RepID=A0ABP9BBM6_9SPHI
MNYCKHVIFFLLVLFNSPIEAKIILPALFADHMVLQQQSTILFSGTANPSATVEITTSWNKKSYKTTADEAGAWQLPIRTPRYGGPYQIDLSDGEKLRLQNVLIGDVWFCSGQSNMEMPLAGWGKINHYEEEIAKANYPNIRLLQVMHTTAQSPANTVPLWDGSWQECSSKSIPEFSATAYFFARELYEKTHVPIGLIHSSWGGTYVEAWMSEQTLTQFDALKGAFDQMKATAGDVFDRKNGNQPTVLYNAMVEPFIHFPIKGAIWYQGESNADRAVAYRELFPAMIKDWRKKWNIGDFPFYFVQLANFMKKEPEPAASNWAMLREAQTYALKLPHTGMAVIADIGEEKDIHPKNKQDVGKRLALQALKSTYGEKIVAQGPILKSYKIKGNEVTLDFDVAPQDLVLKGIEGAHAFAVAGEDKQFHWADVKQEGSKLIVRSTQVAHPVALRYAWANNPNAVLFNTEGLPASPFRTDKWEE